MTRPEATVAGLLGLIGGREHGEGCEAIDRRVLDAVANDDPVVAVVPLASSLRTRARTVGRAVGWWERLGATTVLAGPDLDATRRLLARADVIVMTGGVPDRLYRRLTDTGLIADLHARWRAGVHLVGSSSGAMVVGEDRQSVRPPFAVRPGFGLLPGVVIVPHHELLVPRAVATWRTHTHTHSLVVGIDEATGLVGRDGRFEVLGVGTVAVRRGTWQRTYRADEVVELARLGWAPQPSELPARRGASPLRPPAPRRTAPALQAVPMDDRAPSSVG